ncbi:methyltransferase domain-containing protein [Croceicoccus marinus]|uniref:SAM-dependent methyltransferase n=1 Tax=Croceicoccus marinus TaxID=450378 RepID=A0A1Z1FD23_9SPHN|nr:methyltransferase domain-containing protein [Croceicoccus marinus]ARU16699.1 SAM-dependent methyltransferase [Croceicoccus marinus]
MHDTALEIGRLAIEIYGGGAGQKILEIGSLDVNGSLRQFQPEGSHYLGVDLEAGDGVDMIVKPGQPLPFADGSFDLVLASSVFEHDPAFWNTFLDLVRLLREGGMLYINAPSNGLVHRYPEDHWRFYPDSGRALERWAASQDMEVRLIESFIAPRKKDNWNDFVAVFRKGSDEGGLSGRFIHAEVEGFNVWTIGVAEPLKSVGPTEDMQLLRTERESAKKLKDEREQAVKAADDARKDAAATQATLESRLRQREEEIAQTSSERDKYRKAADEAGKLQKDLTEANGWVFRLSHERQKFAAELARVRNRAARLETELKAEKAATRNLSAQLKRERAKVEKLAAAMPKQTGSSETPEKLRAAEESLRARYGELATMTRLLKTAETQRQKIADDSERMVEITAVLNATPRWWALMPRSWRRSKEHARLKSRRLFDAASYLQRYPDVAGEGMDPVVHFMRHGRHEGREPIG